MTLEQRMLVCSVFLGLVQIVLSSHAASRQYGYRWAASARDQAMPPLAGVAARLDQALAELSRDLPSIRRGGSCRRSCGPTHTRDGVGIDALLLGASALCSALRVWGLLDSIAGLERSDHRDPARIVRALLSPQAAANSAQKMNDQDCVAGREGKWHQPSTDSLNPLSQIGGALPAMREVHDHQFDDREEYEHVAFQEEGIDIGQIGHPPHRRGNRKCERDYRQDSRHRDLHLVG